MNFKVELTNSGDRLAQYLGDSNQKPDARRGYLNF